jgi:hypothetical protein
MFAGFVCVWIIGELVCLFFGVPQIYQTFSGIMLLVLLKPLWLPFGFDLLVSGS